MQTQDAYNNWAATYDSVVNKTRDLESKAIRSVLSDSFFGKVLEIGCGTGKNTVWLAEKSRELMSVDFSDKMMNLAKQKISNTKVDFKQADITDSWSFGKADLIVSSLVLEHIEDISFIFQQAAKTVEPNGKFYICELHPYKQIEGVRARFEKDGTMYFLEYFVHHISDFLNAAKQNGFVCDDLQEWFDDENRKEIPRLVSYLFRYL